MSKDISSVGIFPEDVKPLAKHILDFAEMFYMSMEGDHDFNRNCRELKALMENVLHCQNDQFEQNCQAILRAFKICKIFLHRNLIFLQDSISESRNIADERKAEILKLITE